MDRGIHRKHHPKDRQSCHHGHTGMGYLTPQGDGDQGRDGREQGTPELHRAHSGRPALAPGAPEGRSGALHDPVADYPQAHKAPHLPEAPAKGRLQEHRQGHHKPHVAGTEQKKARQREHVDAAGFGEQGAEAWFLLHAADLRWQPQGE